MPYGYDSRPPMPDRRVDGPPQAAPRNQWPRDVADAVKNPAQASAVLSQIQQICQPDAQQLYGLNIGSTSEGGHGTTTINSATWWSDIGRFARWVEINATDTNNKRINRTDVALNLSPLALLDPSAPFAPFIIRCEDICAARLVTPSSGHKGAFHFGITWENATGVALAPPSPFIGIYANWQGTAFGTWTARCVDDSGNGLDQSLGVTTEDPHRLQYAIDGRGQVVFSIDGEDLLTYDATGSDLGTHTIFDIGQRWTVAADDGATIRGGYMIDSQAIVSIEALDEAA